MKNKINKFMDKGFVWRQNFSKEFPRIKEEEKKQENMKASI